MATYSWTDWLANLKTEYVIAVVIVLLIARLVLGRRKTPFAKATAEIAESALIAIVLVFLVIRPFIVQAFFIPSGSMRPTLLERDHILVNKFIYKFKEPERGDIIVFKSPPGASLDGQEKDFIKRLIGKPGDTITVKYIGKDEEDRPYAAVFRNGKQLKESYLQDPKIRYEMRRVRIPEGKLFVMGDNRNDSNDSTKWGLLDRDRVIGKAMVVFWPIDRIGLMY